MGLKYQQLRSHRAGLVWFSIHYLTSQQNLGLAVVIRRRRHVVTRRQKTAISGHLTPQDGDTWSPDTTRR